MVVGRGVGGEDRQDGETHQSDDQTHPFHVHVQPLSMVILGLVDFDVKPFFRLILAAAQASVAGPAAACPVAGRKVKALAARPALAAGTAVECRVAARMATAAVACQWVTGMTGRRKFHSAIQAPARRLLARAATRAAPPFVASQ